MPIQLRQKHYDSRCNNCLGYFIEEASIFKRSSRLTVTPPLCSNNTANSAFHRFNPFASSIFCFILTLTSISNCTASHSARKRVCNNNHLAIVRHNSIKACFAARCCNTSLKQAVNTILCCTKGTIFLIKSERICSLYFSIPKRILSIRCIIADLMVFKVIQEHVIEIRTYIFSRRLI